MKKRTLGEKIERFFTRALLWIGIFIAILFVIDRCTPLKILSFGIYLLFFK